MGLPQSIGLRRSPRQSYVQLSAARRTLGALQEEHAGEWVALSDCVHDERGNIESGHLVDHDHDLGSLCSRIRETAASCEILLIG